MCVKSNVRGISDKSNRWLRQYSSREVLVGSWSSRQNIINLPLVDCWVWMQHGTYIMARGRGEQPKQEPVVYFCPRAPWWDNPAMLGTSVISVNNRISAFYDHYSVKQSLSILEWLVVCPGISGRIFIVIIPLKVQGPYYAEHGLQSWNFRAFSLAVLHHLYANIFCIKSTPGSVCQTGFSAGMSRF